mgnify:CR=1 FL=1|jgi:hypothetical protein
MHHTDSGAITLADRIGITPSTRPTSKQVIDANTLPSEPHERLASNE